MMMKKIAAMFLASAMMVSLAACGQSAESTTTDSSKETASSVETIESDTAEAEMIVGGWTRTDSAVVTDEVKSLLEKALEKMVGANYTPVAYLGSQVVAGTNHAVLCRIAPVVPDAEETYAIVYIYEDLEGSAEITEVEDFEVTANIAGEGMTGGWTEPETPEVTEEAKAAFEKAMEGMLGVDYVPYALLATQVVAGTNYCILCESTPVVPDAETSWSIAYIYEDLEGNAKMTDIFNLPETTEAGEEEMSQIPNPFVEYETLDEAAAAAGFDLTVPASIDGYSDTMIQVMSGSIIQVIFTEGESRLFVRKAAGSDDISGDYNVYTENNTVTVGDYEVTMKGNEGLVNTAVWTADGYSYAVMSDEAMSAEAMTGLISEIG